MFFKTFSKVSDFFISLGQNIHEFIKLCCVIVNLEVLLILKTVFDNLHFARKEWHFPPFLYQIMTSFL